MSLYVIVFIKGSLYILQINNEVNPEEKITPDKNNSGNIKNDSILYIFKHFIFLNDFPYKKIETV
jgi:hypothetical protein